MNNLQTTVKYHFHLATYYCRIYIYTFHLEFSNLAPYLEVSLLSSLFFCRKINLTKLTSGFGVIINFSLLCVCVCSYQSLPPFSSIYTKNSCRFLLLEDGHKKSSNWYHEGVKKFSLSEFFKSPTGRSFFYEIPGTLGTSKGKEI